MKTLRTYALETRYEIVKQMRLPGYAIPTLSFPLVFYWFFGVAMNGERGVSGLQLSHYLLATYGASGVMSAALFGFGVSVALERGMGWMQVKRATPMPLGSYLTAKVAAAAAAGLIIVLSMMTIGVLFGGVRLEPATAIALLAVLTATSVCFAAMGLAVGCLAGPNSAPGIVNLIFLPLSFLSGLWLPIVFLPKGLQTLAEFLPPFHAAQLALNVLGARGTGSPFGHIAVLIAFTIGFLALAWLGYRRDDGKTYG